MDRTAQNHTNTRAHTTIKGTVFDLSYIKMKGTITSILISPIAMIIVFCIAVGQFGLGPAFIIFIIHSGIVSSFMNLGSKNGFGQGGSHDAGL